ncbi:MAG: putative ATP-dependent RNA helicase DHR1 [Pleopsidium flavum]|nr:MAG: putative ATP-dependent RNA helicase DHR1 [Pleopsidium flavum]
MPKFVPRQRKHKLRQRDSHNGKSSSGPGDDSNATELLPVSKTEREEKRRQLKENLRAQQPKVSSKKQKRLDKYIDKKLQKDENLELIKRLSQSKVDTSLLRSSRDLGAGRDVKRTRLSRALAEQPASFNVGLNDSKLRAFPKAHESDSDSMADLTEPVLESVPTATVSSPPFNPAQNLAVGSGLKRPLEVGDDGHPVIKKRKNKRSSRSLPEPAWEGFDTSSDVDGTSQDESSDGRSKFDDDTASVTSETSSDYAEISGSDEAYKMQRSSAFKSWATQKVNEALGFTPTGSSQDQNMNVGYTNSVDFKARPPEQDPLPPELVTLTATHAVRKAFSVNVERPPEIQEARLGLPVVAEEQKVMEAIHNNPTVVVWGATGSGKTTQVPQFLYEAGYGNLNGPTPGIIGVTQPRRVAAVSMAKRVDYELGSAGKVSYQIRFESNISDRTAIKFMTDGILLREIGQDFALTKYSVIVIDEAHERSANTDILIGMVSRIVDLRATMSQQHLNIKPLKLVIMSATLRISDFTENRNLFRNSSPPLLQAEGRQYPVSIHFVRKTQRDYLEEAFRKVCKGHRKLPAGGILVFLTGQNEISALSKRLKQTFASALGVDVSGLCVRVAASEAPLETEDIDFGINEDKDIESEDGSGDELAGLDDDEDARDFAVGEPMAASSAVHVLPLYSQLPTKEQLRVFEPPPEGSRMIVLATNVAETSITIPGIRYVFDTGRAKEKQYDRITGVQSFEVGWISKASANQRAGRAGRTGPGHCYRLYSSAVYERDFNEYAEPEILRMPIEGVVLQLKSMDLQHVTNFPFPTPPDRQSLVKAEKLLTYLGAISSDGKITPVGRDLSIYPLSPRFSKMLLIGHQYGCMPYTIAMVAALAVADIFIPENQLDLSKSLRDPETVYTNAEQLEDTARENRKKDYNKAHYLFSRRDKTSDALKLLTALCAYPYAPDPEAFCAQMFLRQKALKEASQLRQQLTDIVRTNRPGTIGPYSARLDEPLEKQLKALKQILAAGFIDQVAIRADLSPIPPEMPRKPKRAIDVPYLTLFPSHQGKAVELDDKAVYLHPSSVLAHSAPKALPQYIIYSRLQRGTSSSVTGGKVPKLRMHALTPVSGLQLSALAHGTPLLSYGKPIGKIEALEGRPERRECWVVPALVGEGGGLGWPLPAKRVVQRRDGRLGWVVERVVG